MAVANIVASLPLSAVNIACSAFRHPLPPAALKLAVVLPKWAVSPPFSVQLFSDRRPEDVGRKIIREKLKEREEQERTSERKKEDKKETKKRKSER